MTLEEFMRLPACEGARILETDRGKVVSWPGPPEAPENGLEISLRDLGCSEKMNPMNMSLEVNKNKKNLLVIDESDL